jgi:hypothetical protein
MGQETGEIARVHPRAKYVVRTMCIGVNAQSKDVTSSRLRGRLHVYKSVYESLYDSVHNLLPKG